VISKRTEKYSVSARLAVCSFFTLHPSRLICYNYTPMTSILKWQIELIVIIQKIHNPLLDHFFQVLSWMGTEPFYILLFSFLFWCIDTELGYKVALIYLFSTYINENIKYLLQQPRPFDLYPDLKLSEAEGYGFPSGHAQSSTVIWITLAWFKRKIYLWLMAFILILIIGFSRIYLGLHFPTDVLGGWITGIIIIFSGMILIKPLKNIFKKLSPQQFVLLSLVLCIVLFFLNPVRQNASVAGTMAGVLTGIAYRGKHHFTSKDPWKYRILRLTTGVIITSIIYLTCKLLLEGFPVFLNYFPRYYILGLWITAGAPELFYFLGLIEKTDCRLL